MASRLPDFLAVERIAQGGAAQQALEKVKRSGYGAVLPGQLKEAKENEEEAIAHYREVKGGEYQLRRACARLIC
jgi:hypothetical protein